MGLLKALMLAVGLVFFGGAAFFLSILAALASPVFPGLRFYSNSFFLIPFGWFARKVTGLRVILQNPERIHAHRPAVFIGNHQSGLDLAVIGMACPARTVIVGKQEIGRIPFFGWFFWIAGNLLIDRSDKRGSKSKMDSIRARLEKNRLNLAIFPEGTRSKTGSILPFKRGAFYLAASAGYPIIPVVCSDLTGKGIWENFGLGGGKVIVSILEPVPTLGLNLSDLSTLSDSIRSAMIREYERVSLLAAGGKLR
jgi:1-acyl-sn-glycerol-3-phosphate acyltransferase